MLALSRKKIGYVLSFFLSKKVKGGGMRKLVISKSPSDEAIQINELHGTKDDKIAEGWLVAAIKTFGPENRDTFSQPAASAFARTSTCCIKGCKNLVEVGAHVTTDGKRLFIIPTCKYHNGKGVLDKLGIDARLKKNTIFLKLDLPKGKRIVSKDGKAYYDAVENPDEVLKSAIFFDDAEEEEDEDE